VGRTGGVGDQLVFGSGKDGHRYSLGVSTESGIHAFHTPGHIEAAYNSGSERDLTADGGWAPTLHTKIDSAEAADREVARGAGAGRIP
jgi:pectate lyase